MPYVLGQRSLAQLASVNCKRQAIARRAFIVQATSLTYNLVITEHDAGSHNGDLSPANCHRSYPADDQHAADLR
jgi:hypothetical protein